MKRNEGWPLAVPLAAEAQEWWLLRHTNATLLQRGVGGSGKCSDPPSRVKRCETRRQVGRLACLSVTRARRNRGRERMIQHEHGGPISGAPLVPPLILKPCTSPLVCVAAQTRGIVTADRLRPTGQPAYRCPPGPRRRDRCMFCVWWRFASVEHSYWSHIFGIPCNVEPAGTNNPLPSLRPRHGCYRLWTRELPNDCRFSIRSSGSVPGIPTPSHPHRSPNRMRLCYAVDYTPRSTTVTRRAPRLT